MLKGFFYILIAALIDGAQILISIAFTFLGALSGTIGGAAAGQIVVGKITTNAAAAKVGFLVGGFFGSFLSGATGAIGVPLGMIIGFILGVILSLTLGTSLVMLLAFDDMFYPAYVLRAYIGEVIPGLDVIPSWTALVIFSIMRKKSIALRDAMLSIK